MSGPCKICDCIGEFLVSMAALEALEHNAITGEEHRKIGKIIKKELSKEMYDEIVNEHPWLEDPLIEWTANVFLPMMISGIDEKCDVSTSEIKAAFNMGIEADKKKQAAEARTQFIKAKTMLLNLAKELCEEK